MGEALLNAAIEGGASRGAVRGGWGYLDEGEEGVDEGACMFGGRELGEAEALGNTCNVVCRQGVCEGQSWRQDGEREDVNALRNAMKEDGASACRSVSDYGDRLDAAVVAGKVGLHLGNTDRS